MESESIRGAAEHAEPVLAVSDIDQTVNYWHEKLGFPQKWTWGDPVDYGGVSWNRAFIQFSKDAERAASCKRSGIFVKASNLQSLYEFHQSNQVEIVEPLENKPWGMAGYTVREINGYYIIFAGALLADKTNASATLPSSVRIVERLPSVPEYQELAGSVGWTAYLNNKIVEQLLSAPVFAVVAEDVQRKKAIGCALLLGDHASFYYVKDLIVHPEWQCKRVGSTLMKAIDQWLNQNGANKALVSLVSGEHLARFYGKFGFTPAFGMTRYIDKHP